MGDNRSDGVWMLRWMVSHDKAPFDVTSRVIEIAPFLRDEAIRYITDRFASLSRETALRVAETFPQFRDKVIPDEDDVSNAGAYTLLKFLRDHDYTELEKTANKKGLQVGALYPAANSNNWEEILWLADRYQFTDEELRDFGAEFAPTSLKSARLQVRIFGYRLAYIEPLLVLTLQMLIYSLDDAYIHPTDPTLFEGLPQALYDFAVYAGHAGTGVEDDTARDGVYLEKANKFYAIAAEIGRGFACYHGLFRVLKSWETFMTAPGEGVDEMMQRIGEERVFAVLAAALDSTNCVGEHDAQHTFSSRLQPPGLTRLQNRFL